MRCSCVVRPDRLALLLFVLSLPAGAQALTFAGPAPGGRAGDSVFATIDDLRGQSRHAEALLLIERRLAHRPDDDDAYRLRVLTLADLGSSRLAAAGLAQRPALFADHERERIEGDAVARRIGWAEVLPENPRDRLAEARTALEELRTLQRTAPRLTRWESTRLRVDALAALNQLHRHEDVAAGYRALLAEDIEVPAYILATVGDSLLALRRPAEALPVLEQAVSHEPGNVNATILLGYAWLELERFDRALPVFAALAASQPARPRRDGAAAGYENWDRYSADVAHAMAHSHANDHARADDMLQALVAIGPHNASLQAAYGAVQARRLRPSAALERYRMAATLDPYDRDALAGQVGSLVALERIDEAADALQALQAIHPHDPRSARIARDLDRHRGAQFALSSASGRSNARGEGTAQSPFGSRDASHALELRSPLLAGRWRVGVVGQQREADFDDIRTRYRGAGVGGWYRHDRLGAAATVWRIDDDDAPGPTAWTLAADWRLGDAWRIGGSMAHRDADASLQARRAGITADSLRLSADWTPDDTLAIGAHASHLRYDDGNTRDGIGVDASTRLHTRPHLLVDALASVHASRGSHGEDAAYFNPSRDASMQLGLRLDHITWRRYGSAFRQRLELHAGPYWQQRHGSQWIPAVGYRHVWRREGGTFEYGVTWSRPVYDGVREQRVALDAGLRWGGAR
ncbi:poly-beta-1,6 N-acetyl-D-glucosamine export porin PgaA [Luteimonas sp. MHLX1A]|uniref:poly-beta-1,6 N-acetyl-D-glucosamine export porin PgaA n=1 Tax=Alterluteimonas muca TaxID=2878684 RepID=UPI001E5A40BA|nr:poly-beta-1,6 N-acetyl-D-glucosamine export porin PgaA [Luteimonas sp. MHLX1A]MCD9046612.1 poly-beta-1,6 N-acetyl-D-glucosamine export porin PgaA [Luteimonas sp. MHLX1A]